MHSNDYCVYSCSLRSLRSARILFFFLYHPKVSCIFPRTINQHVHTVRFHYSPKAKDDGGDAGIDMAYQSRLWSVILLFVGHRAFGGCESAPAIVFADSVGAACWAGLKNRMESLGDDELHKACRGPKSKFEFHATYILLLNHLVQRAHEYLQWLQGVVVASVSQLT